MRRVLIWRCILWNIASVLTFTKAIIQQILTKVCKIDAAAIKDENNDSLATLRQRILDKIYGQDKAVDKVVEAVMMAKAGLTDDDKPLASLLFVGLPE